MSTAIFIKASNKSGPINFTFQVCGIVPIFEGIYSTEEYHQGSYWIIKLGCFEYQICIKVNSLLG